jgi:hypothetical protein
MNALDKLVDYWTRPAEKLTADEIEVRTWAFVVKGITALVIGIAFGILYAVAFVPEDKELAPIDAVFLEILKAIAFMGVGTLGGISGRKAISTVAQKIAGEDDGPAA